MSIKTKMGDCTESRELDLSLLEAAVFIKTQAQADTASEKLKGREDEVASRVERVNEMAEGTIPTLVANKLIFHHGHPTDGEISVEYDVCIDNTKPRSQHYVECTLVQDRDGVKHNLGTARAQSTDMLSEAYLYSLIAAISVAKSPEV